MKGTTYIRSNLGICNFSIIKVLTDLDTDGLFRFVFNLPYCIILS